MIVLDTRWITDSPSGIGVYIREMLTRIPRLAPDLPFHALFRETAHRDATWHAYHLDAVPNLTSSIVPCGPFSLKNQFVLPPLLKRLGATLYHSPNYLVPYLAFLRKNGSCRCIANIHDIIPLVVQDYAPNSRTKRLLGIYRFCLAQTLRCTDVITGSEATCRDLVSELHLSPRQADEIHVIMDGAAGTENALSTSSERPPKGPHEPRTLLYVGRRDPYKNVPLLVDALQEIRALCPFPVRLRVVGPKDPRYPEAEQRAQALGLEEAIDFTGFVTEKELSDAYQTADLLTHPSRYEGFGLQLVEAMKAGLPVVCTDGGSQPEVAGDAAVIVPHNDVHALAQAAASLLQNPSHMEALRARGFLRVPLFSWDRTAAATLDLYRSVLSRS